MTRWKVALQGLAISRLFFTAGGLDSHLTTAVYHSETEKTVTNCRFYTEFVGVCPTRPMIYLGEIYAVEATSKSCLKSLIPVPYKLTIQCTMVISCY